MKKKIIVLISLLIQLSTNAQWIKQLDVNLSVCFINKNLGWAYDSTPLYKTSDGGVNWQAINVPKPLHNLVFTNENIGYANAIYFLPPYANNTTRIMKTTNGGLTWMSIYERLTSELRSIFFINKDIGWVCFEYLMKTTDGGQTWQNQFKDDGDIKQVYFINENKGWLLTSKGHFYSTTNGGEDWKFNSAPSIQTIDFITEKVGFASSTNGTYKTIDGGSNWNQLSSIGSNTRIKFFDHNSGIILASQYNRIYKTEDGCKTWINIPPPVPDKYLTIQRLDVLDNNNYWVINRDGIFKKDTTVVLQLTQPSGNATLYSGFQFEIKWNQINLESRYTQLEYSTDNGISWKLIADSVKAEDQSYLWNLPVISNANNCLIRIKVMGYSNNDTSDSTFQIVNETRKIFFTELPDGKLFRVQSDMIIKWDANYSDTSHVKFEFLSGGHWGGSINLLNKIASVRAPWYQGTYRLKISDISNPQIFAISGEFFVKSNPQLEVYSPAGNEIWQKDSIRVISFISTNINRVNIDYTTNSGADWIPIVYDIEADSNVTKTINYSWKIPDLSVKYCQIRFSSAANPSVYTKSKAVELTRRNSIINLPLEPGNKWFFKSWVYPGPSPEGIRAIWLMRDKYKLTDGFTYSLIEILTRNQDNSFKVADSIFVRQNNSAISVRHLNNKTTFYHSMNFDYVCGREPAGIYSSSFYNDTLRAFQIGIVFNHLSVVDSIGFVNYNTNSDIHSYGTGCVGFILNGKKYGETLDEYVVGIKEEQQGIPTSFSLSQNYPNPFNPSTTIRYQIPVVDALSGAEVLVSLKVFDLLGREVATLVDEYKQPGSYQVNFNAGHVERSRDIPSGVYFYRMHAGSFSQTKKIVLMK